MYVRSDQTLLVVENGFKEKKKKVKSDAFAQAKHDEVFTAVPLTALKDDDG